jgi:hypothetical protein
MILTAIFLLVLLIGISLFVAVVGTAFLRRHSTRVGRPGGYPVSEFGYGDRYRREYQQKIKERSRRPGAQASQYPIQPVGVPRERVIRESGAEGKWLLITVVVLIVIVSFLYFGLKGYQNFISKPKMYFCESVDFAKQRPVNSSDTFTRGNVNIFFKSPNQLEFEKARIDVYRIDSLQGLTSYATKELPVKPEWTSFSFKVLFGEIGTYAVMLYDGADNLLVQEYINIVPDSYAYRPVRKP